MNTAVKIEGLGELLENLKDEVAQWTLEGSENSAPEPSPENSADTELIRRGLYLTAMDILLAEMHSPGGYESYCRLPDRIILPEGDYQPLRKALDPYIRWFKNLLFQHATALSQTGVAEHDAFTQAVVNGTETLDKLSATTG